jgi:hypothetical protein
MIHSKNLVQTMSVKYLFDNSEDNISWKLLRLDGWNKLVVCSHSMD